MKEKYCEISARGACGINDTGWCSRVDCAHYEMVKVDGVEVMRTLYGRVVMAVENRVPFEEELRVKQIPLTMKGIEHIENTEFQGRHIGVV